MQVGEIFVKLGLDSNSFDKDLNQAKGSAEKASNSIGSKFTSLAGTVASALAKTAMAVGAGMVAIAGTAIKGASDLESYRQTLNSVMGDEKKAGEMFAWANDFANRTPYENDEVIDATVKLQSYGLEVKKLLPIIGDMTSTMNKGLDQGVEAIADAQTGELERLKEFGITKQQIVDKANQIFKGKQIVNNQGQITDMKRFNEALIALMTDPKKGFVGGMERQANAMKGIFSTITGTAKSKMAEMVGIAQDGSIRTGSAYDVIKQKMKGVADQIDQMSKDGSFNNWSKTADETFKKVLEIADKVERFFTRELKPTVQNFCQSFVDEFAKTGISAKDFKQGIDDIKMVLGDLWSLIKNNAPEAGGVMGWFFGVLVENAKFAIDSIKELLLFLKDVIDVYRDWKNLPPIILPSEVIKRGQDGKYGGRNYGGNALGTDFWRGGLTWVGERGAELVNLPMGSQVIPNNKVNDALSGGGTNITIQQMTVRNDQDIKAVARELYNLQRSKQRLAGAH